MDVRVQAETERAEEHTVRSFSIAFNTTPTYLPVTHCE